MRTRQIRTALCATIVLACPALVLAQAGHQKHAATGEACLRNSTATPLRPAAASSSEQQPLAVVEGQPIYARDINGTAAAQLLQARQQEYKVESDALDALIAQRVVEIEAKKKGLTIEQLYQKEVDSKIPEPSDDEARGYYLAVKGQTTLPFEQIKSQVKQLLRNTEVQEARKKYAESLRGNADIAIYLRPPAIDVGPIDAARVEGNPDAPVTIVEFGDFQCPFCGRVEPTLQAVLKKYNGEVKLAFRDFPLTAIHAYAEGAAVAGRCAEAQGKFWQMHDAMYADQSKLTEADLEKTADGLGMNESAFAACMNSGKYSAAIQQDLADGGRLGVSGTPSFFINGQFLSGAQSEADFGAIIDRELAAKAETPGGKGAVLASR